MSTSAKSPVKSRKEIDELWSTASSSFGNFELTEAVRIPKDSKLILSQGFRRAFYVDSESGGGYFVLQASVTAKKLFDTFISLLDLMEGHVTVVLKGSHTSENGNNLEIWVEEIDINVLKSYLYDYVDLFLNDGCTEIAVLDSLNNKEIVLDEHKFLIVYSGDEERIALFERTLIQGDVYPNDNIALINDGDHIHNSTTEQEEKFHQFCYAIGVDNLEDSSADSASM